MEVTCGANTFSSLPSQLTPEPPEIRPMAAEVQVVLHHGTILPCDAHGLPRPSITWQREGVPIAAGMGTAKTGSTSVLQYSEKVRTLWSVCLKVTDWRSCQTDPSSSLASHSVMREPISAWPRTRPGWQWAGPNWCFKVRRGGHDNVPFYRNP